MEKEEKRFERLLVATGNAELIDAWAELKKEVTDEMAIAERVLQKMHGHPSRQIEVELPSDEALVQKYDDIRLAYPMYQAIPEFAKWLRDKIKSQLSSNPSKETFNEALTKMFGATDSGEGDKENRLLHAGAKWAYEWLQSHQCCPNCSYMNHLDIPKGTTINQFLEDFKCGKCGCVIGSLIKKLWK